jgi:hypothetical protein
MGIIAVYLEISNESLKYNVWTRRRDSSVFRQVVPILTTLFGRLKEQKYCVELPRVLTGSIYVNIYQSTRRNIRKI